MPLFFGFNHLTHCRAHLLLRWKIQLTWLFHLNKWWVTLGKYPTRNSNHQLPLDKKPLQLVLMSPGATHATIGSKKRYIKPARPSNGSHQLSQDLDVITQKNTKKNEHSKNTSWENQGVATPSLFLPQWGEAISYTISNLSSFLTTSHCILLFVSTPISLGDEL